MKRISFLALASVILFASQSPAQRSIPTAEHFDYSTGELQLVGTDWIQVGSGADAFDRVKVVDGNLTYLNYPMPTTGRMAEIRSNYRHRVKMMLNFSNNVGETLYASFLLNVYSTSNMSTTGEFFIAMGNNVNVFMPRLYAKSSGVGFSLGISKSSTTPVEWLPTVYSVNTTYLVVMKVEIVSGTGNDIYSIWMNPDLSGPEPTPDISVTSGDDQLIDGFYIRQVVNGTPNAYIDAIRIANTWSESALPVQMTNFSITSNRLTANLKWVTSTEIDNFGFDIERRRLGENVWQKIGFVAGRGNANSPTVYSYTDEVDVAGKYIYRLKQINRDGTFEFFSGGEVEIGQTTRTLTLGENYPNPFNPATSIEFTVPEDGLATLKVYNIMGQEVATLFNAPVRGGVLQKAVFDASGLPSGLYFSRLQFGNKLLVQKMVLAK